MTTRQFNKKIKGKTLEQFTKEELLLACQYEKFNGFDIYNIAKSRGWKEVIDELKSYEDGYKYA